MERCPGWKLNIYASSQLSSIQGREDLGRFGRSPRGASVIGIGIVTVAELLPRGGRGAKFI